MKPSRGSFIAPSLLANGVVAALLVGLAVGCSQGVSPIDPRDPSLPIESRRWLAAAQDGLIAARARRDSAQLQLEEVRGWADRTTDGADLDERSDNSLEELADARVRLAELELEIADAAVVFADVKLTLTYAERAVHHDLGSYDLVPLQESVDAAREDLRRLVGRRDTLRQAVRAANAAWWEAYSSYAAGGGNTRSYWIGDREPITDVVESEARDNEPRPEEEDGGDDSE